jgi:hypothetical protein
MASTIRLNDGIVKPTRFAVALLDMPMDEQEITPCDVRSRNIEHYIADNFTALDDVVCFGNALQRKALGDSVDKLTLLQQVR